MPFHCEAALVTGGWGYIGSVVVRKLVEQGVKVTVMDKNPPNDFYKDLIPSVHWIQSTVDEGGELHHVGDVGSVFHIAGRANVRASVEDPKGDFYANVVPTVIMLDWCKKNNVKRFVFTSSVSVCDQFQQQPLSEAAPVHPSSPYGAAKAAAEGYCRAYARTYGLHTVIARLFNVYGLCATRLFVADVAEMLLKGERKLALWGGGQQVRDYLHVEDVADGLILLSRSGKPGETYNLASGQPVTLAHLATEMARAMTDRDIPVIDRGPTYAGDIMEWVADTEKISALGFQQRYPLKAGIKKTALWIKENRRWFLSVREKH